MSKASEWAKDKSKTQPVLLSDDGYDLAEVTPNGHLYISEKKIYSYDVLRLRDWLTETFDETSSGKEGDV